MHLEHLLHLLRVSNRLGSGDDGSQLLHAKTAAHAGVATVNQQLMRYRKMCSTKLRGWFGGTAVVALDL